MRAGHGTAKIRVEAGFGSGNAPEVQDAESGLKFRGRIDRLDLSGDGSSALVIDYKTGSAVSYGALDKDVIDRGRRLQLGIYSLAARRLFPEVTSVRAAYWFTRTGSRPQFAPSGFFDIGDNQVEERFRQGVETIVSGIGRGVFTANPGPYTSRPGRAGPENCLYCDFDSICPARRVDIWQRKKPDALLKDYLTLAGEGGEQ